MKPFLLLSSRAEDLAADEEYEAFLRCTGLADHQLRRIRVEAGPLPELRLDDWSGLFFGGGPFNSSDPPEKKSAVQVRVELQLTSQRDQVVARDFPFLGACYGVGTLGVHQGGIIDRKFGEPISAVRITLTEAGLADPVLAGLPAEFDAFVGHKEACRVLPPSAVLLASSATCPVQMFRVKRNIYATQFHPELDVPGIVTRIRVYQYAGYYAPAEMNDVIMQVSGAVVTEPGRALKNFVACYA